jgi:hypothetical protein
LKAGPYATAALVPATPWLGTRAPDAPQLALQQAKDTSARDRVLIRVEDDASVNRFAIWTRYGSKWVFAVQAASQTELTLETDPALGQPDAIVVSAVNRLGIESAHSRLQLLP